MTPELQSKGSEFQAWTAGFETESPELHSLVLSGRLLLSGLILVVSGLSLREGSYSLGLTPGSQSLFPEVIETRGPISFCYSGLQAYYSLVSG